MTIEQFNDAKYEELKFIGTGSIDDRMRSQIVAVVGSTQSERAYWLNLFPLGAGTLNDIKSSYFRSLGYTGSLQDMEHRYWASGKGSEGFIRALFINNEPGTHFEAYDPNSILRRRNLLTWSEDFSNAAWLKTGATCTASGLLEDGSTGVHAVGRIVTANTVAPGGRVSAQIRVKAEGRTRILVLVSADGSLTHFYRPTFNLSTGQVVGSGGITGNVTETTFTIVAAGDGYYDIMVSAVFPLGGNGATCYYYASDGNVTYTGTNGLLALTITRAQLELGARTAYQKVTDWNTEYIAGSFGQISMWQDAAGTTATYAVEQPVGLWMDRKFGMVQGAELRASGVTALIGAATAASYDTGTGAGSVSRVDATNQSYVVWNGLSAAGLYAVSLTNTGASLIWVRSGGSGATLAFAVAAGQTLTGFVASAGGQISITAATSGTTATFSGLSVKFVPGAHATQSTSTSRPTLSARYNLLTKTEQFDDAAWTKNSSTVTANVAAVPGGAFTGDKLVETAVNTVHSASTGITFAATDYRAHFLIKAAERQWAHITLFDGTTLHRAFFNLGNGTVGTVAAGVTATITPAGDGWYWCAASKAMPASGGSVGAGPTTADNVSSYLGDGVSGIYLGGADLRTANDAALNQPTYQRVNTATDYDTEGFVHYLRFDGTDDSLQTPAIDFSGVDKVLVVTGATKLSDAATAILAELTASSSTTSGSFLIASPASTGGANVSWRSRGALLGTDAIAAGLPPPAITVLTGIGDISGNVQTLRVNGVVAANASDVGDSGNFSNAALNIGRRNGSTLPYNGRLTSLTVRGSTTPASTVFVRGMEQYAARLAGQVFVSA